MHGCGTSVVLVEHSGMNSHHGSQNLGQKVLGFIVSVPCQHRIVNEETMRLQLSFPFFDFLVESIYSLFSCEKCEKAYGCCCNGWHSSGNSG